MEVAGLACNVVFQSVIYNGEKMKGFLTAINVFKFVANKRAQNQQRKHDLKMAEFKIEEAKEAGKSEIVATLAQADAVAAKNPQGFMARLVKFGIGLCLIAGMVLMGLILYQAGEGDTGHFEVMVRFITLMENSPNFFFGCLSILGVFVGGRALSALVK